MPTRLSEARKRGLYPSPDEPAYLCRQVSITIKLPPELWPWLRGFVGNNSFSASVEDTIITALRCMAGNKSSIGMDMQFLLDLVTMEQEDATPASIMFRRAANPEGMKAANVLLRAAHYAAYGVGEAADSGFQEDEDSELILKAWSAAAPLLQAGESYAHRNPQTRVPG
jgi:hypothetical protein